MRAFSLLDRINSDFYHAALAALDEARVEFLVGGAFALGIYTGMHRDTKDVDLFIRPSDVERALAAFRGAGLRADYEFSHWLAKVFSNGYFMDIIYRAGNGLGEVDDRWFEHSNQARIGGRTLRICPPEEMIWQKAYVMERERFDGADIQHLLRSCAGTMDWERLVSRFGPDGRVLLSHLVMFGFVFPSERDAIPMELLRRLFAQIEDEPPLVPNPEPLCCGTLVSRAQYLFDVEQCGYRDGRTDPRVRMTDEERRAWTDAGRS